jgi:superfamily I DNA and/or RNA helicase
MNADQKKFSKFNVLTMHETLEELNDIKSELLEVLLGMKAQETSGRSSYTFGSSTIFFKKEDRVRVKFTDILPKEWDNLNKDIIIREDDVIWFIEEGYDNLDKPKQIKGIVVDARRLECVIEFNIKGKNEEVVLSGQGILKKEFNKKSIETQISMIERLISLVKLKKMPFGVIPYVFRISELPFVDLGSHKQWMTETFKNKGPDPSQEKAIKQSLQGPAITILKGPPGTGKTSVIAEIALQLLSNKKTVLITSQTNSALDNIVSRIVDSIENVNLLRITSTPQIIANSKLRKFSSEELIAEVRKNSTEYKNNDNILREINEKLYRAKLLKSLDKGRMSQALIKKCKEAFGDLDFSSPKVVFKLQVNHRLNHTEIWKEKERLEETNRELETKFVETVIRSKLASPGIIAATCVGLFSNRISKPLMEQIDKNYLSIGSVILDEASKASRSESLIPLAFSSKAVVVGDERQLPPYMEWSGNNKSMDPESLFDNLIRLPWLDSGKTLLNSNYRSHKTISDFISKIFYESSLISKRASSFNLTQHEEDDLLDLLGFHLIFINHEFHESLEIGGNMELIKGAYQNKKEVEIIINILKKLEGLGIAKEKIAFISPYRSQVRLIRKGISAISLSLSDYEVDTVDSFQGREKPLVIVSLTRSNDKGFIGFVRDLRRLNVMFSRAEDFLLVVGNSNLFTNLNEREDQFEPLLGEKFSQTFRRIMEEFKNNGKIISYSDTIFPGDTE